MRYKNVALVIHPLLLRGGAEDTLKVISEMFNRVTIYTAWYDEKYITDFFDGYDIRASFLQSLPYKPKLWKLLIPVLPFAYKSMKVDASHDLVIVVADGFEKLIRVPKGISKIAYVLTPPRFLWLDSGSMRIETSDIFYKIYNKYLKSFLLKQWRKLDLKSFTKFDSVASISDEVRQRVAQVYNRESTVIYPPVDLSKFKYNRNTGNREDWFLYLGRIEAYKGVELAVRAAIAGGYRLKVAGTGQDLEYMKSLVEELGGQHLVGFLGYVTDKTKRELLFKCRALLSPIYKEDFGIVPVEANFSGAPVIAHRSGGAMETVIDNVTGMYFDTYEADALLATIKSFEKASFSAESCHKQAMQFSRDAFENKLRNFLNGFSKR